MKLLKLWPLSALISCMVQDTPPIVSDDLRAVYTRVIAEFETRGLDNPFRAGEWIIQTDNLPRNVYGYIEFDGNQIFIAISKECPNPKLDFETFAFIILLHELGHWYGLEHDSCVIMDDPGTQKFYTWEWLGDDYLEEYFELLV